MAPTDERAHGADLSFEYDSSNTAVLVADAVSPEVDEIDGDRTTATVTRDGSEVRVDLDADDLVALRAGLNTWETLVEVAERMVAVGHTVDG